MHSILRTASVLLAVACLAAHSAAQLPFAQIAADARARHQLDGAAQATIHEAIDRVSVRCDLGAFDLRFPAASLADRGLEFTQVCDALLATQEAWLQWIEPAGAGDSKALRADLAKLRAAIKEWKPAVLAKAQPGADMYAVAGAAESVRAAARRAATTLRAAGEIGPARAEPKPLRFCAEPTRDDFVQALVLAGDLNAEWKSWCWDDGIAYWTQVWFDDAQVTCLQYAAQALPPGTWKQGTWMNERDPDVMQQQIAQLAANQLLSDRFGDHAPAAFIGGLALNIVVDIHGQCNTRIDGDLRSRKTEKREVFIAGGLSEGGRLGKNVADTRWREDHGRGHFLAILRQSQKEGEDLAKQAKFKPAAFGIRDDAGGNGRAVLGPFIGSAAATTEAPPEKYLGDYAEFTRAYKCGFVHWLKSAAEGSPKKSGAAFARLLVDMSTPTPEGATFDFEGACAKVYGGDPLSAQPLTKDTLEGRFLVWLSKQKG
jgi:hypothetical protein